MIFTSVLVVTLLVISGIAVLGAVTLFRTRPVKQWFHWVAAGTAGVLALGTFAVLTFASHVVRVHADGTIDEARVIGTATVELDGHEVEVTGHGSGITIVLDEMDHEIEIRTLVYGELAPHTPVPPDTTVAAHTAYTFHGNIDYLGPHHPPPSEISTKGGGKVQYWLTW